MKHHPLLILISLFFLILFPIDLIAAAVIKQKDCAMALLDDLNREQDYGQEQDHRYISFSDYDGKFANLKLHRIHMLIGIKAGETPADKFNSELIAYKKMLFKLKDITLFLFLTFLLIGICSTSEGMGNTDQIPVTEEEETFDEKYNGFLTLIKTVSGISSEDFMKIFEYAISSKEDIDYTMLISALKMKYDLRIDTVVREGKTLLELAVENRNWNAAQAFYHAGANMEVLEYIERILITHFCSITNPFSLERERDQDNFEEFVRLQLSEEVDTISLILALPELMKKVSDECVQLIYKKILESGHDQSEALAAAVYLNLHGLVSYLIQNNVDPMIDEGGLTLLHLACYNADKEMVSALLKSDKFDINAKTKEGFTPIMAVAESKENNIPAMEEIVHLLIQKGVNNESLTEALPKLIKKISNECVQSIYKKILESGHDQSEALAAAVYLNLHGLVSYLIQNNVDPMIVEGGLTLLHLACYNADKEMVSILLKSDKFDINAKTEEGFTLIDLLVESKENNIPVMEEIVHLLIQKGVNNQSLIEALPKLTKKVSVEFAQSIYEKILDSGHDLSGALKCG